VRIRVRKLIAWAALALMVVVAGVLGFAYSYVTDGATLVAMLRAESPRFLPGSQLSIGGAQVRPLLGQVELKHVRVHQPIQGRSFQTAWIAWMHVSCDVQALLHGRFEPTEVSVSQPVLRITRRADGSLNLKGLLADPWPAPPLATDPVIRVKNGRVELIDESGEVPTKILSDVELTAKPIGSGSLRFDGSARGGPFDRVTFEGTYDRNTGRLELTKGEMTRLALLESLEPSLVLAGVRDQFLRLGLQGGEADLTLSHLSYHPSASTPLRYNGSARLRGATLARDELPMRLSDVAATISLEGDRLVVDHAEARDGKTSVQVRGFVSASDPVNGPLDLRVDVTDLELDDRLRAKTPPEFAPLWAEYRPEGWINLGLHVVRAEPGAPVGFGMTVLCRDVGMTFHLFPYPLRHIQGTLKWEGATIDANLRCLVAGEPLVATGRITNPGLDALVQLDFRSDRFPVDDALLQALPPEIQAVVHQFQPTGSVRGVAHLVRKPPKTPGGPEDIAIHAELDLNEGCSMRWAGMPYLVRDLTGHLDLRPDRWTFRDMKGRNGTAQIALDGEVVGAEPGRQAVALRLRAEHLPFDHQLRDALPPQWQATWATLKPSGVSRVDATIEADPGEEPHYHLRIVPEPAETRIKLALTPVPGSPGVGPGPGRAIELPPMENISGTFLFDDGTVTMSGVKFTFREAPVAFDSGEVELKHNGGFTLIVQDLLVTKLRLDAELRRIMPPVMGQFAQRLDDGKTFWLRGNLGIGWSGLPGEPARCEWSKATVVFNGNTVQTGLPLERIQGQVEGLWGWSDGQDIEVHGIVNLDSVELLGQQVSELTSPLSVKEGLAVLENIEGRLLGGTIRGTVSLSLAETPHYVASLDLHDADLARYALTLPGRQELRGRLSGWVRVEGEGNELRSCIGEAGAQIAQANLGELPLPLRWVKVSNLSQPTKTAFDAAEIRGTLGDGRLNLDTLRFTGDAISLEGNGTVKLQGDRELDLRLMPRYGRNERRVPLVSDWVADPLRDFWSKVLDLHVTGPLASPRITPEPLPDVFSRATEAARRRSERRETERTRR
jgi:hypothetical protein